MVLLHLISVTLIHKPQLTVHFFLFLSNLICYTFIYNNQYLVKYMFYTQEGETWQDGPCRQCECFRHGWVADCTVQRCAKQPTDPNFVIETVPQPHLCCPDFKRIACRVGNQVFKVRTINPRKSIDQIKQYCFPLIYHLIKVNNMLV